MTITYVDSTTNGAGSGTAISCAKPAGVVENDLLLAFVNANGTNTVADNNGAYAFAEKLGYRAFNTNSSHYYIFYRIAGAGEPSTYNFTMSGSERWSIIVKAYRSVDLATIWDVAPSASTENLTTGTTIPTNALTTNTDGAMAIAAAFGDHAVNTFSGTPGDSFNLRENNSGEQLISAADKLIPSATTQAAVNWTASASTGCATNIFALLPAAAVTASYTWGLEAYISAAWEDISRDVLVWDAELVAGRGIKGYGIGDRVATPGMLTCAMDNSIGNSAGLVGYYSPAHANMRANFGRDTRVRLKIVSGGTTRYVWHGWIDDLKPTPGQFKEPTSYLSASDYMQKMVKHKLDLIAVQENKRGDELVQTVLDNMPSAPLNTSIETKSFKFDLGLFGEQDEKSTAMSAMQKICVSGMDYLFIRGNATDGETLVFQSEATRAEQASASTLDDTMSELSISSDEDKRINKLTGLYHPLRIDPEPDILLAELTNDIPVEAGQTITVEMRFRDPSGKSVRISGMDIVTALEADTHYRMSAFKSSANNDMNDYLSLTVTAGGNKVSVQAENIGSLRGFINKLEIYGRGIYLYDPLEVTVESGDADKAQSVDFYYLSDYFRCKSFTEALHSRTSDEHPELDSIVFFADADSTLMGLALNRDIGDRITVVETATGLNNPYTINYVEYTIQTDGRLRVEWQGEYAGVYGAYFTLDDATKGVLDSEYVLSPF